MADRYDACTPRKKKDGGTYWVKIGSAWSSDGKPPQIVLDALPIPDAEGRCVISLFEPRNNDQPRAQSGRGEARQGYDDGDSVPF